MIWASIVSFAKKIPGWLWGLVVLFIVWRWVDFNAEKRGREKQQANHDKQQLEEQAEVLETRRELSQEREDANRRADEAVRDLPEFNSVDELRNIRPDTHGRLFGDD